MFFLIALLKSYVYIDFLYFIIVSKYLFLIFLIAFNFCVLNLIGSKLSLLITC